MTVSTDAQLRTRTYLADEALVVVNAARTKRSATAATLAEYRTEAYRQILVALRAREISPEAITRPDDLIEAEVCLLVALVCEAAATKPDDLWAMAAASWRARYTEAIATASPVDGQRGQGRSFTWSRA